MIPVSVEWEQELWELRDKPDERQAFLEESGLKSVLPRIVKVGYNVLNLSYYFTAGIHIITLRTIGFIFTSIFSSSLSSR